jgi:hypothetical protein
MLEPGLLEEGGDKVRCETHPGKHLTKFLNRAGLNRLREVRAQFVRDLRKV